MFRIIRIVVCYLVLCSMAYAQEGNAWTSSTICWDTSYSMFERDLEQELDLLDKIFERSPDQKVQLLLFDITVEEHEFTIENGDWNALREVLVNTKADGATYYGNLEGKIKHETVYYFTDGKHLGTNELLPIKKGNIIINSVANRDEAYLKRMALLGKGRLMDLAAIFPDNIVTDSATLKKGRTITGTVYLDNEPARGIEVRIKGSHNPVSTDDAGKFAISAVPGDSILVSSKEDRTLKLLPIGYFDKDVDVFLESNVMQLEEVIVSEKRIEAQNIEMVNTSIGLQNKEGVGYAVQSIDDNDIIPAHTEVSSVIQGKFSGVSLKSDQDLSQFKGRDNNTLLGNNYGLVVLDGIPMQTSASAGGLTGFAAPPLIELQRSKADLSFLNPDNIADITVLKGFAATNRYGALGNGGVLLITTKNGQYAKGKRKPANSALVQNNVYDPTSEIAPNQSAVFKALKATPDVQQAYGKYLELRSFNMGDSSFLMDCFQYFRDKDHKLALRILSNMWETHPDDENVIKIMELSARAVGNLKVSEMANRRLNQLKPLAIQPFFTEAQLALEQGDWQKALDSWSVLSKGGNYGSLEVSDIQKSVDREIKNLILHNRADLRTSEIEERYFKNEQMNVRLKLEWSDPKAEFHVQFVNPQNRYFDWEHTSESDAKRLQREVSLGYAMEEFEVYDDLKGEWQVNVNYLGNMNGNTVEPLVLLCSKYTDFGLPSQKRELIWIYVDAQSPRKSLVRFKI
ncbi:YfaP family protein [Flagellimonas crocea]|uniref:YfaP family protein n=1 Tax=Flagellimonas crocea TaxID=3067311 RepID=UPI00296F528B|nr:TonB-dependent receptor plug domain-containing protein [Muricauda sp. DH64]